MGSWVERYLHHPASVWETHWLRIPRACVQADSLGNTLTLVIHLDQLQPLVARPACEEWALAQEQGGGKTGFLSSWGPFLFPPKHMANTVWAPCSCLLALSAGCADDLPKASVIHPTLCPSGPRLQPDCAQNMPRHTSTTCILQFMQIPPTLLAKHLTWRDAVSTGLHRPPSIGPHCPPQPSCPPGSHAFHRPHSSYPQFFQGPQSPSKGC